ncbi:uncharacterized protein A4U43_C03F19140 [Asparagus officinalis]|uniref:Uncharacterized protein n=1 Tax=Asparagus officinalis TaxID=4686 RepID=A0A5P1FD49_ASPOF|nr:uncharacterized protein A4U43_C03F19140 [Asparagus officinalis]
MRKRRRELGRGEINREAARELRFDMYRWIGWVGAEGAVDLGSGYRIRVDVAFVVSLDVVMSTRGLKRLDLGRRSSDTQANALRIEISTEKVVSDNIVQEE